MSPQDRQEFEKLKQTVNNLHRVEDLAFIANLLRQLDISNQVRQGINNASINDLNDVDITSPSNGQVIKYTTSGTNRWVNGTDNTA